MKKRNPCASISVFSMFEMLCIAFMICCGVAVVLMTSENKMEAQDRMISMELMDLPSINTKVRDENMLQNEIESNEANLDNNAVRIDTAEGSQANISNSQKGNLVKHVVIEVIATIILQMTFGISGGIAKVLSKLSPLRSFSKKLLLLNPSTGIRRRRLWISARFPPSNSASAVRCVSSSTSHTAPLHTIQDSFRKLPGTFHRISVSFRRNVGRLLREGKYKKGKGIVAAGDFTDLLDYREENEHEITHKEKSDTNIEK